MNVQILDMQIAEQIDAVGIALGNFALILAHSPNKRTLVVDADGIHDFLLGYLYKSLIEKFLDGRVNPATAT